MITYDGIDVRDIRKDDPRRSLGAVLQDTHLFTGTVMDNIRYGRLNATDEECIAAAKSANAHSFIRRLPTATTRWSRATARTPRRASASRPAAVATRRSWCWTCEATSSIDTRTERHIAKRGMDALMEGTQPN